MMPDIEGALQRPLFAVLSQFALARPGRAANLAASVRSDGYVDFRTTGRDIRLRIDLASPPGVIIDGSLVGRLG